MASSGRKNDTPERIAARTAMNREILEDLQDELAEDPALEIESDFHTLLIRGKRQYFPHPVAKLLRERQRPVTPEAKGDFASAYSELDAKPVVLSPLSDTAKTLIFGAGWEGKDGGDDDDALDRGIRRELRQADVITELRGRGGVLRCSDGSGMFDIAIKIVPAGSAKAVETEYSALQ